MGAERPVSGPIGRFEVNSLKAITFENNEKIGLDEWAENGLAGGRWAEGMGLTSNLLQGLTY